LATGPCPHRSPFRLPNPCENMYVKEVTWENGLPGEWLIVCYNPLEARVDAEAGRRMVCQVLRRWPAVVTASPGGC